MGWIITGTEVKERPGEYKVVTEKYKCSSSGHYMTRSDPRGRKVIVYATEEASRRAYIAMMEALVKHYQDSTYSPAYRKAKIKEYQWLLDGANGLVKPFPFRQRSNVEWSKYGGAMRGKKETPKERA